MAGDLSLPNVGPIPVSGSEDVNHWVELLMVSTLCYTTNHVKTKVAAHKQAYRLPVVIEKDRDGYYAFCPSLQGCYTQGDTYEEVITRLQDAMRLHLEDRKAEGE